MVKISLSKAGVRVQSLVGELRSQVPCSQKKQNIKYKQYCTKFNKDIFLNGPISFFKKLSKNRFEKKSNDINPIYHNQSTWSLEILITVLVPNFSVSHNTRNIAQAFFYRSFNFL